MPAVIQIFCIWVEWQPMKRLVIRRSFIVDQIVESVGEGEPETHAFLGALDAVRLEKLGEGVAQSGGGAACGLLVLVAVRRLCSVRWVHQVRAHRVARMRRPAGAWAEQYFVQLSCDVRCVDDLVWVESEEGRDVS